MEIPVCNHDLLDYAALDDIFPNAVFITLLPDLL